MMLLCRLCLCLFLLAASLAGCAAGPDRTTPTPMIHASSMGALESGWAVAEVPAPFRGDWQLLPRGVYPRPPEVGPGPHWPDYDYASLIFRLRAAPAECRVLVEEGGRWREIGTMPYLSLEGDEMVATFTGSFHLTYTLRLRPRPDGGLAAHFDHAGSGMVYYSGEVDLARR